MSELSKELQEQSGLALWKSYCDKKMECEELQSQLQTAQERIKELEQALSEEIKICPSAKANNEEYCFRAKVCSICSNNRYIKELLPPQPKGE